MSIFIEAELDYLASQHLMRFATASPAGKPDVTPVGFSVDRVSIVSTSRARSVTRTCRRTQGQLS
jgi:hypothetical protein